MFLWTVVVVRVRRNGTGSPSILSVSDSRKVSDSRFSSPSTEYCSGDERRTKLVSVGVQTLRSIVEGHLPTTSWGYSPYKRAEDFYYESSRNTGGQCPTNINTPKPLFHYFYDTCFIGPSMRWINCCHYNTV